MFPVNLTYTRWLQKALIAGVFCFVPIALADAQEPVSTAEQIIADMFEQYAEESEEEVDYEDFYSELLFFYQYPIQLNTATREELERLPFLSAVQVENILAYRYYYGNIQTIYELQLIEGLDMTDIRRLLPFTDIEQKQAGEQKWYWREMLMYGKNEVLARFDNSMERKKGYLKDASGAKAYSGNSLYHSLKYKYGYKNYLQAGLTAEKDAGEPFWSSERKGYDFLSGYVRINNVGRVKTVVLGDFRASFGQGLTLRSDFVMGKSAYVLNVLPRNAGLKKYGSTGEADYFRGAGVTVSLGKMELTAFYSNKMIDGDTADGKFPSIYKTGLHRTESELNKKQTVNHQLAGGNLTFTQNKFQIGATLVHTRLNHRLTPDGSPYNRFYFSGNRQTTGGIHYRLRLHKLNFFGESAVTADGAFATVNGALYSPISRLSLVAVYRYYAVGYDTFYAKSLSETSRINNERGVYLGSEIRPFRYWKFSFYADSFYFPWIKYGIDAPSSGNDVLLQADYAPKRDLNMFWRFRYKSKMQNVSGAETILPSIAPNEKLSLRYNLNYTYHRFGFKNIVEGNVVKKAGNGRWTYGVNAIQDISYSFAEIPLKMDFSFRVFDAENYDNRIYAYEKDILYAFSIPVYYGIGNRYYLTVRYEPNENISFWFKIAQTVYADDRDVIGSGNEQIQGNRKTDIRFLLRWKL
ncbi:MAG: helix-hairpin-helix domain-containing protein [Prevotellaceae bacterium]|jgi:hypothetical protein|nr:helix-hairpin-helix domain-containing protein [Prevotellaceae bacterium]